MKDEIISPSMTAILRIRNYGFIAALLLVSWLFSAGGRRLVETAFLGEQGSMLLIFFEIIVIFTFGFLAYEAAKPTVIPSFVLAIFIGMIEKDTLAVLVSSPATLTGLTIIGAIFILFGGGLDTPFTRFRELIGPILSMALVGTILTAFLFSVSLSVISAWTGITIPLIAIVLLGAALSSTDPAAIIPSFKALIFRNPRTKYIAVSESAINDVVGAVLTGAFAMLLAGHAMPGSIVEAYAHLLSAETGMEVLKELLIGTCVGIGGFVILHYWSTWKAKVPGVGEADAALFLAVPLLCYVTAMLLHGNGFLAVFISSLLFHLEEHFQHVEHYFNHTIEGFMKPLIFMLLGAIVDVGNLISVASLGIMMGLVFMFVLRPIAVFATLSPFMWGKHRLSVRELLFLSFVRETGVIPAVLLVSLQILGFPGSETIVAVGLWVILLTLIVQPPLTPLVARLLGIAIDTPPFPPSRHKGAAAVLCSRGDSFLARMDAVSTWALKHGVPNVLLLHCPEGRYSQRYIGQMEKKAKALFDATNANLSEKGLKKLQFEFIGRQGLLQNNIEQLLRENHEVSVVFVGSKMLDYRLQDVKRLQVPFVFIE